MEELINKLNQFYSMSRFDLSRNPIREDVDKLEEELKVFHKYEYGKIRIFKLIYESEER